MNAGFTCTHLPWVWSFHALHAHALRPGSCVPLLGHPLAMGSERPYALAPRLVHSNGRPTHVGCIHACAHVSSERWRATGPWLVHELAVVCLVWCHLEGGAHLENKKNILLFKIQTQIQCLLGWIYDCAICNCETTSLQSLKKEKAHKALYFLFSHRAILIHVFVLGFLERSDRRCGSGCGCSGGSCNSSSGGSSSRLGKV